MANPYFQFKDFCVWHDRCAMKVGTDGVLLGAWTDIGTARTALDVGTGSGLIALMLASRSDTLRVTAIDIDADAVAQATDNFTRSAFASRLEAYLADFCRPLTLPPGPYDLIVSNPPFFTQQVFSPDSRRSLARSTSHLPFEQLLERSARLLAPRGRLSVIIPSEVCTTFIGEAAAIGLRLCRRCDIRSTERKAPVRTLLELSHEGADTQLTTLTIHAPGGEYSPQMQELTGRFYL